MKTVLTAAAVATLTLAPPLTAWVGDPNGADALLYANRRREPRHQREERLREAHRRASRAHRETRHAREERWREADL